MLNFFHRFKNRLIRLFNAPKNFITRMKRLDYLLTQNLDLTLIAEQRSQIIENLLNQNLNIEKITEERSRTIEYMLSSQIASNSTPANIPSTSSELIKLSHHFQRNFLPNDDSALQKQLVSSWNNQKNKVIGYKELLESAFRVYSQNDEDGILLRIFAQIESTNKCVIEIGSNCNGSEIDIPENSSTNLIVNHGWHGTIFEIDPVECEKMQYFFARHAATRHFHWFGQGYYSPQIIQKAVSVDNINSMIPERLISIKEPDLMIVDIDSDDYAIVKALNILQPRVLVVEFEKRFRDRFSVVMTGDYNRNWQSGMVSLPAWEKLLTSRGYILCAINIPGFNAFFIRSDVASGKIFALTSKDAFDLHPIFFHIEEGFWLTPDNTWQEM